MRSQAVSVAESEQFSTLAFPDFEDIDQKSMWQQADTAPQLAENKVNEKNEDERQRTAVFACV